jgi:NADPH:quinone reductase-like Zn-dependent oxidoreductase
MWTYVIERADGPLERREVARPEPAAGQLLVRIAASGVNPLDTKIRGGRAAHAKHPLPAVPGLDMAGVVEAAGAAVTKFRPGDEVYGMVGGVGGIPGTLAEYVVADADLLAHKPKQVSMREAAALPLVTITAWEGLVDRAKVHEGATVLVHAGAGGVGHIVVQLARAFGAQVFATVSSEKSKVVEEYGAVPIDYHQRTVEQYVNQETGGAGFDIVYDTLGGATLDASFLAVKRYTGHVASCVGWGTHALAPLSFRAATYSGVFTLLPLLSGQYRARHGEILAEAAALADAGKLRPLLNDRNFTFDDVEPAYAAVASGSFGKVVIG